MPRNLQERHRTYGFPIQDGSNFEAIRNYSAISPEKFLCGRVVTNALKRENGSKVDTNMRIFVRAIDILMLGNVCCK